MIVVSKEQIIQHHSIANFTDSEIVDIGLSIATGKMNDGQLNDLIINKLGGD